MRSGTDNVIIEQKNKTKRSISSFFLFLRVTSIPPILQVFLGRGEGGECLTAPINNSDRSAARPPCKTRGAPPGGVKKKKKEKQPRGGEERGVDKQTGKTRKSSNATAGGRLVSKSLGRRHKGSAGHPDAEMSDISERF